MTGDRWNLRDIYPDEETWDKDLAFLQ